jgi:hypothetical protein
MTKLSLGLLFVLLVGCGKAPEMKTPNQGKSADSLIGKTNSEIISLKYNNNINLDCAIRVKKGFSVDLNEKPVDSFTWNISGELSMMRVLNYKIAKSDTVVVVRVADKLQFVDNQTVLTEDRKEYFLEHTPILTISYRRDSRTILTDGTVHERMRFTNVKLFENIESRVFTLTNEDNDGKMVTEDLRCMLRTNINPAYKDQWNRVR